MCKTSTRHWNRNNSSDYALICNSHKVKDYGLASDSKRQRANSGPRRVLKLVVLFVLKVSSSHERNKRRWWWCVTCSHHLKPPAKTQLDFCLSGMFILDTAMLLEQSISQVFFRQRCVINFIKVWRIMITKNVLGKIFFFSVSSVAKCFILSSLLWTYLRALNLIFSFVLELLRKNSSLLGDD